LLRTYLHDIRRARTIVETTEELSNLADAIRKRFAVFGGLELELPKRGEIRLTPDFRE